MTLLLVKNIHHCSVDKTRFAVELLSTFAVLVKWKVYSTRGYQDTSAAKHEHYCEVTGRFDSAAELPLCGSTAVVSWAQFGMTEVSCSRSALVPKCPNTSGKTE